MAEASDRPCDSEPPDLESNAYQALFRAVQHYGHEPHDRDASAFLILHWALALNIARHGLEPTAGMCLAALEGEV